MSLRSQNPSPICTKERFILTNTKGSNAIERQWLAQYREASGRLAGMEDLLEFTHRVKDNVYHTYYMKSSLPIIQRLIREEYEIISLFEKAAPIQKILLHESKPYNGQSYFNFEYQKFIDRGHTQEFNLGYDLGYANGNLTFLQYNQSAKIEEAQRKSRAFLNQSEASKNKPETKPTNISPVEKTSTPKKTRSLFSWLRRK